MPPKSDTDYAPLIAQVRSMALALKQGEGATMRRLLGGWDQAEEVPKGLHHLARILAEEQAAQEADHPQKAYLSANPFPALWVKGLIFALITAGIGWIFYLWAARHPGWLALELLGFFMMLTSPSALLIGRSRAVCPACAKISSDFSEDSLLTEEGPIRLHRCPRCGLDFFRYRGVMLFERGQAPDLRVPHDEITRQDPRQLGWLKDREPLAPLLSK